MKSKLVRDGGNKWTGEGDVCALKCWQIALGSKVEI